MVCVQWNCVTVSVTQFTLLSTSAHAVGASYSGLDYMKKVKSGEHINVPPLPNPMVTKTES